MPFKADFKVLEALTRNMAEVHVNFLLQYISPVMRIGQAAQEAIKIKLFTVELALFLFNFAPTCSLSTSKEYWVIHI